MAYSGPAIDTHHHIWLRKDVAWLADPPIPRMFGDYFGIRRDYPVEEFIDDVKPQGVTKSVHITAMWGPGRALEVLPLPRPEPPLGASRVPATPRGAITLPNLLCDSANSAVQASRRTKSLHLAVISGISITSTGPHLL